LTEYFPRIAKAYLIGTAADEFSAVLAGEVPHVIAGDIHTAVRMAADDAAIDRREEPTVLLSPACASFDHFADFEARGEAFRRALASLDETPMEAVA
jgi:UDP-N-acetylmuramoylalanine--D-glutamate ligase